MKTSPPEVSFIESLSLSLNAFTQDISQSLMRLNQWLEQQWGAELTTALAIGLGAVSLVLALLPLWSAWRRPSPQNPSDTLESLVSESVLKDSNGQEVVQMHPERLQQLYGVPLTPLTTPEPVVPVMVEPAMPSEKSALSPSASDMALGLMADLSEALAKQQEETAELRQTLNQQQQVVELLMVQMKAQSSAFLLQGERLLQLENGVCNEVTSESSEAEDSQRLSTFDQAIRLASSGASTEQLMAECGLSQSEARLVVLVHGQSI
jgi:hypothetical protein